jgi:hypothetical protein
MEGLKRQKKMNRIKGQIEGHQVDQGNVDAAEGQQRVEGPEGRGQQRHEHVPGFAVIAHEGPLVGKNPPDRLDEPARLAQGVEELSAGVPHFQHVLYEIEDRDFGQGAGALHKIGRSDDPAHPAQAQLRLVPADLRHARTSLSLEQAWRRAPTL